MSRRRTVHAARKPPAELREVRVVVVEDTDPDPSYLDQEEFEDRREAYQRGDFYFVGVRAEAEVVIEGTLQTLQSGGLWGIESDSERSYFEEVANEEWSQLRDVLKTVGVATKQLPLKADPEWIDWGT